MLKLNFKACVCRRNYGSPKRLLWDSLDMQDHSDTEILTLFEQYLLQEKRVSKNSFNSYFTDLKQLSKFFKKEKLTFLTADKNSLKSFLKRLKKEGVCPRTISRKISTIKLFYSFLSKNFKVPNISVSILFPKVENKLPIYLKEFEIEKLLQVANKDFTDKGIRNKVMLYLLYATGLRVSELVSIKIDQIDFKNSCLDVTKNLNKKRTVPLPLNVLNLISFYLEKIYVKLLPQNYINYKEYLFITCYKNQVRPITRQSFWIILKILLVRAGISKDVSPSTLRHCLAVHLLKNGLDLKSLQILLGHENIATVQVYLDIDKAELRKVYDKKHPRA